jgi:hypothetical protein
MEKWHLGAWTADFFAQVDAGPSFVIEGGKTWPREVNGRLHPLFTGGVRAGARIPLVSWTWGGPLYIEPYIRIGYPYLFGMGAAAGMSF